MDAAGDLASRVQAGDHVAVGVQHMGVGVDHDAAHGVVDGGLGDQHVVRALLGDRDQVAALVEFLVLTVGAILVPVGHGLLQVLSIHAEMLAARLEGISLHQLAAGEQVLILGLVGLGHAGLLHGVLIPEQVRARAGLFGHGLGDHVAGLQLLDEALALLVHQHAVAVQAHVGHVQQRAGLGVTGGIGLDVLHVHGIRADGGGHGDAVAGAAHCVGGQDLLIHGGVVGLAHLHIGAEAAGGQHHVLRAEFHGLAVVLGLRADDLAILHHQLGGAGVGENGHAQVLDLRPQLVDQLHGGSALRHQGALHGVAAEEQHVVLEFDIHVVAQPLGRVQGVGRQHVVQLGIAAGLRQVGLHLLHAVHAFLLQPVAGRGDLATGQQGVAADVVHLFDQYDVRAGLLGLDSSSHARAARADHQHIAVIGVLQLRRFGGLAGGDQAFRIDAGLRQGVLHGGDERGRGQGRAGDGLDVHGVAGQHLLLQILHGHVAQALGLFVFQNVDVLDRAALNGDLDGNIAGLAALADAGKGAVLGKRGKAHRHHQSEHQTQDLLHNYISFCYGRSGTPQIPRKGIPPMMWIVNSQRREYAQKRDPPRLQPAIRSGRLPSAWGTSHRSAAGACHILPQ